MSQLQADSSELKRTLAKPGNVIVVTGPSGVGKGTVVDRLLGTVPNVRKSVSVTTRQRRGNEVDGVDYFFRSTQEFEKLVASDMFMEWAEFAGNLYGTPKAWVSEQISAGQDVILEIEVQGAKQIKKKFAQAVLIFLSPPSFQALEERLRNRGTETEQKIALRLAKAKQEMSEKHLFHYEVVNDNIDEAVQNLVSIVYAERCRLE
jgi:guanylate kinase